MDPNCSDQEVFFGVDGSGTYLQKQLANLNGTRVLFVTGKDSFRLSGAKKFLSESLDMGIEFRFSDFSPNPTYDDVLRGVQVFADVSPDCIIAIGGGSVLDMAKLVNFFGSTRWSLSQYFQQVPEMGEIVLLPLIAIPTTAGAGSESTGFSVLYKDKKKHSVAHPCLLPDVAILNPELTLSMSPYQTACCGFDALSQAVESYWAAGATDVSQPYSAKALTLCMQHLEGAVLNPTIEHRTGMMEAAYLAGKAINIAKTTAAHALSYTLTAHYGLPHGHAVAMMLPWIFEVNAAAPDCDVNDPRGAGYVRTTLQKLCMLLGGDSSEMAIERLRELMACIGLTNKWFSEKGVDLAKVRSRIIQEVNQERLGNNPRRLSREILEHVAMHIQ